MDLPILPRVGRRPLSRATASALALLAAGCSPVRILNDLAPSRLAGRDIPYEAGARHRLDVYAPAGEWDGAPVLVFLYGGNWDSGSKEMYRFVGGAYAAAGFVTIIPDYRLYPEVTWPAFLQDNAVAVAWALQNAGRWGGDTSRGITLMGHSAGAYDAAMLGLDARFLDAVGVSRARDLAGVVGLAGPYDFLPLHDPELEAIFRNPAGYEATQPIAYVDGSAPRMMLAAGARDRVVRPANTRRLAARIRACGGHVEEFIYPGIGHRELVGAIAAPLRFLAPVFRDTLAFMG